MSDNEHLSMHELWLNSGGDQGACANFEDEDMTCSDLRKHNFSMARFEECDFSGSTIKYANFSDANLSKSNFDQCSAASVNFSGAFLIGCNFQYLDAENSTWYDCRAQRANFENAILNHTDFRGANLSGANFRGAHLYGADLTGAKLPDNSYYIGGEVYPIIIMHGEWVNVGCQCHSAAAWRKFSTSDISAMDGKCALNFYPRLLEIMDFYKAGIK